MKTPLYHKLLTALLCGGLLASAGAAEARGDRDHRGWDRHGHTHKYKHAYKHKHVHRGWDERHVVPAQDLRCGDICPAPERHRRYARRALTKFVQLQ